VLPNSMRYQKWTDVTVGDQESSNSTSFSTFVERQKNAIAAKTVTCAAAPECTRCPFRVTDR
jgi:hypothetical protein